EPRQIDAELHRMIIEYLATTRLPRFLICCRRSMLTNPTIQPGRLQQLLPFLHFIHCHQALHRVGVESGLP
ncbi:MAG: hypothetical protein AB2786_11540, partial [Candidatus Thiodiazotropha endolucinida]